MLAERASPSDWTHYTAWVGAAPVAPPHVQSHKVVLGSLQSESKCRPSDRTHYTAWVGDARGIDPCSGLQGYPNDSPTSRHRVTQESGQIPSGHWAPRESLGFPKFLWGSSLALGLFTPPLNAQ